MGEREVDLIKVYSYIKFSNTLIERESKLN